MTDVITFFFQLCQTVWNTITSHWILAFAALIAIMGFIVDIVTISREQ